MSLTAFVCAAALAIDGDTLRCAGIGRARLALIQAPDSPRSPPCRAGRTALTTAPQREEGL